MYRTVPPVKSVPMWLESPSALANFILAARQDLRYQVLIDMFYKPKEHQ